MERWRLFDRPRSAGRITPIRQPAPRRAGSPSLSRQSPAVSTGFLRDSVRQAAAALAARRSARSRRPAGIVLVHHDVAASTDDPRRSLTPALSAATLRAQLINLRRRYRIVSLAEFSELIGAPVRRGHLPVALTFDDDLASHHRIVAPILTDLELPATFFLTGTSLDGPASFWWLDLQQLFRAGGEYWAAVVAEAQTRWGPHRSYLALGEIARTIEMLPPIDRDAMAAPLRELAAALPGDAGLSTRAVRELVAAGYRIGFHTRAHYHLQTLDDAQLHTAVRDGADRLAAIAGYQLDAIAYPHGAADLRTASAAGAAGFTTGCVVRTAAALASDHPLLLPRVDGWAPPGKLALLLASLAADVA
jgi:peptidoglycan/xylan/chitin deacetylase (PgdA/CDA1 family)